MLVVNQQRTLSRSSNLLLICGLFLVFVLGFGAILQGPSTVQPPGVLKDGWEANDLVTEPAPGAVVGGGKEDGKEENIDISTPAQDDDDTEVEEGASSGMGFTDDISDLLTPEQHAASLANTAMAHHEITSNMTSNGKYFRVDFLDEGSYNPNMIPHSYKPDTWIIVAQRDKKKDDNIIWNTELVCEATFIAAENTMRCKKSPMILPIASTMSKYCTDEIKYFNNQIGPHDARVFYGPNAPYIIYMSQSNFNCLGQWIQDLRRITDWDSRPTTNMTRDVFYWPTNMQRPPPYGMIEKNWFAFWDFEETMYLHYDITPTTRVFAKLEPDGSVGRDLATVTAAHDEVCMEKLMPKLRNNTLEWLHQATNSLSVTMCARRDPTCVPSKDNTYIMTIFQTKSFYWHGNYEPYVMLFRQEAPFEIYGITTVPFWISGRGRPEDNWAANTTKPKDQNEMIFTTSVSWKLKPQERGGKVGRANDELAGEPDMLAVSGYHGYIDDDVFLGFGVEDQASAGIDVRMSELLINLKLCNDTRGAG